MYKTFGKYVPYLFLIPALALLVVFFFIPFLQTLGLSVTDYSRGLYSPEFCGFKNYFEVIKDPVFLTVLANTFLFLILVVPFLTIFPLFVAILINQKLRGINIYKVLIYLPVVVSIVVCAIAFKWLYAQDGILNYFLSLIGISPISWLTDTRFALISVAIVTAWKGVGYYMIIYLASLMNVPKELYEAAEIDGANSFQKHLAVSIPHLMPVIALVSTISAISAMKVFAEIYVMTKGGPLNSSKTIVYYIYERAFENLDLGMASAMAVVLLLIVLVMSAVNIFCFERDKYRL